jgi:hypothetical protein
VQLAPTTATQRLKALIQGTFDDLTQPILLKQFAWVTVFGAVAIVIMLMNINFLRTNYADAVRPQDLILDNIPQFDIFVDIAEYVSMFQGLVVLALLWYQRFVGAPRLLFILLLMFLTRSFTMILTPLADTLPIEDTYASSNIIAQHFYYGMFFSGHTASAFIQAFFFKGNPFRPVLFGLAMMQVISLFLSHGHYSIDIVAGFFVAYTYTHFDFMRLVPERFRYLFI